MKSRRVVTTQSAWVDYDNVSIHSRDGRLVHFLLIWAEVLLFLEMLTSIALLNWRWQIGARSDSMSQHRPDNTILDGCYI